MWNIRGNGTSRVFPAQMEESFLVMIPAALAWIRTIRVAAF
jgi:hypothetical protein